MSQGEFMRIVAALLAVVIWGAGGAGAREIALSFDDAPRPGSVLLSGPERARRLIAALADSDVEQAVFFANTVRMDAEGEQRLRAYGAAGHLIGNHSAHHLHLRDLTPEAFLADVAEADRGLRPLPGFRPWFRFPFLDEGDTPVKRDAVRVGLEAMGYAQGYVTIDTYDWYLDNLAREAAGRGDQMDMAALGALYVEAITASADFHDRLAERYIHRSPRHILLLHENDLAALFIDDLVAALRRDGWTIATAETAYDDPIAAMPPDTMLLGQGRVAALAYAAGAPRADVFAPYEEESELDAMFAARVLHR
jgi:peptidoglycan/xylan/chitin deacetylase (PgdA/CDA1 family)